MSEEKPVEQPPEEQKSSLRLALMLFGLPLLVIIVLAALKVI